MAFKLRTILTLVVFLCVGLLMLTRLDIQVMRAAPAGAPLSQASPACTVDCFRVELFDAVDNGNNTTTLTWRVIVDCTKALSYVAFELPSGVIATTPANGAVYIAPSGRQYTVENPTNNPFRSIKFNVVGEGVKNGGSDLFAYTLPGSLNPAATFKVGFKAGTAAKTLTFVPNSCQVQPTPTPTWTNTPVTPATNTPVTPATDTPAWTPTNTPVTPATDTPVWTPTDTPVTPATDTPAWTPTDTPAPPATATPTAPPQFSARGVIAGEVYDDSTGLPLAGVTIQLTRLNMQTPPPGLGPATTDTRGRFFLVSEVGLAQLRITRTGFTSAVRPVTVVAGRRTSPFDARLTPLDGNGAAISPLVGGTVTNAAGDATLVIPSFALSANASVFVTQLSGQGLAGRLPRGWSPVTAIDIQPGDLTFATPATLAVKTPAGLAAGATVTVARWNAASAAWVALGAASRSANGAQLQVALAQSGQLAFVVADAGASGPPAPVVGQPLAPATSVNLPATVQAQIEPSPRILLAQPDVHAQVSLAVNAATDMQSGEPLQLALRESYTFTGNAHLYAGQMTQDFTLYAFPAGQRHLQATLVASPSRTVSFDRLRTGAIDLAAHAPVTIGEPVGVVLTPGGGRVSGPAGAEVVIPAGAAAGDLPVLLSVSAGQLPVGVPAGMSLIAALQLELAGAPLALPAVLSVPAPAGLTAQDPILVAQVIEANGASYLALAATAQLGDGVLTSTVDPFGDQRLTLPGIRNEGVYLFLRAGNPIGFISGSVANSQNQLLAGALLTVDNFPLVALAGSAGQYALAAAVGTAQVTALDPQTQDTQSGSATVAANALVALDFGIVPTPPTVVSVNPVDGSVTAPLTTTVSVVFSRPVERASVTAGAVTLHSATGPVNGTITLAPGDQMATFRPQSFLRSKTSYTVTVTTAIRDRNGRALAAPFVAHFTTLNQEAPPPPPAAALNATIPNAAGFSTVTGSQGTVQPDWLVIIRNLRTSALTTVQPQSDGSFSAQVPALKSDRLELVLRDENGRETRIPLPPFQNPDGSTVVGAQGGTVTGQDGVFVAIDPGSLPDGTVVKVEPVALDQLPLPPPSPTEFNVSFVGGLSLHLSGVTPQKYMHVGIPAPAGAQPDDQVLVMRAITLTNGSKAWTLIDQAHLQDGNYVTASPPFPGVIAEGEFAFLRPSDIIVPGPDGVLQTVPLSGSDDDRQDRYTANGVIRVITGGPNGVLQTAPAPGSDDERQRECMSFIAQSYSLGVDFTMSAFGIPFAYPAFNIGRVVMVAYCNQPLLIQAMAADTGELLVQINQQAPAQRNQIVYAPERLTNDHQAPHIAGSVLPTQLYDDLQEVVVQFSEPMDYDSLRSHFVITDSTRYPVSGTVEILYENTVALFRPAVAFRLGVTYTVNLSGATDFAGNPIAGGVLSFARAAPRSIGELRATAVISDALKKCVNATCYNSGQDVAVHGNTLFIANGIRVVGEQYPDPAHPKRLLVVDTSNPTAPRLIGWHATTTNPRALALLHDVSFPVNPAFHFTGDLLVVTGGGDSTASNALNAELELYDVTACVQRTPVLENCLDEALQPQKGLKYLSTAIGQPIRLGVPPDPGVVKQVAVLHQQRNVVQPDGQTIRKDIAVAYAVVVPIGLEAIDLMTSFNITSTKTDRFAIDGLYRGGFFDVAVLKNLVVAAEEPGSGPPRLKLFSASLVPLEDVALPRAFRITSGENFVFDIDRDGNLGLAEDHDNDPVAGKDEVFDLAVVASGGRITPDGRGELYVIDLSTETDLAHAQPLTTQDPAATNARIFSRIPLPGSAFEVCVDPAAKLAYVDIIGRGLAIVDLSHVLGVIRGELGGWKLIDQNQDGLDDRILYILQNGGNPAQNLKGLSCSRAANDDNGMTYVNWEQSGPDVIGMFSVFAPSPVFLKTDIDVINNVVCGPTEQLGFTLTQPATVTVSIDGHIMKAPANLLAGGADTTPQPVKEIYFQAGRHQLPYEMELLKEPGEHKFTIQALFRPGKPAIEQTFTGVILHDIVKKATLPIGHTMVGGVDLWDGHLTLGTQDLKIPGRGLSLELARAYSSAGSDSGGPMGAGWTHNYDVRLVRDNCNRYLVIGGEGTGNTFINPHGDSAKATLFSSSLYQVPPDALFLDPQVGYHSTLIQDPDDQNPQKNPPKFDFFTKAHVRYHFEREEKVPGEVYTLRFIEEPNGNRISLDYKVDNDPTTLDKVTDSSGRSLNFTYKEIFYQPRVTHVTADVLDPALAIDVGYGYDGVGNLVAVTRTTPYAGFGFNDERVEQYTYARKDPNNSGDPTVDEHNLLTYKNPNGQVTQYVYYTDNDAIPGWTKEFNVPRYEFVKEIRQPENVTTAFTYNLSTAAGPNNIRTVSRRRPNLPPTRYTLDSYGATVKVEEPLGKTTITLWCTEEPLPAGCNGRKDVLPVAEVDALGRTHRFQYDGLGNLVREEIDFQTVTDASLAPVLRSDGQAVNTITRLFTYDALFGKTTSTTDAEAHTTYYCIESPLPPPPGSPCPSYPGKTGNLRAVFDAAANQTQYDYYDNGDLRSMTNPRGYATRYVQYDGFGNVQEVIGPENNTITNRFDNRGRLLESFDSFSHHTRYRYDGLDRMIREERLDDRGDHGTNQITEYRYSANGELLTLTDGLGQVTEHRYDGLNRQTQLIERHVRQADDSYRDPPAHQYFYDEEGNLAREIDARGVEQRYVYDALNRLLTTTLVQGPGVTPANLVIQSAAYDLAGNKRSETDLHGNTASYLYDRLYRVVETRLPFSHSFTDVPFQQALIRVRYDLEGHKLSETDANGRVTTYQYDPIYRLTLQTDADGNATEYGYDAASNQVHVKNLSSGLTIAATYDKLNRILTTVQEVPLDATGDVRATYLTSYSYLDAQNAMIITNPGLFKTRTDGDGLDRVFQVTVDEGGLNLRTTYTYDANGNVATVSDPQNGDVDVTHVYDGLNRKVKTIYVSSLNDNGQVIERFSYDDNNNLTQYIDRRGIVFTSTYDNLNRVLTHKVNETLTNGGAALTLKAYQYDDALNRTTETDANGNVTITQYDSLNRPTLIDDPDPTGTVVFQYDGVNQRVAIDKRGLRVETDYDAINRPLVTREFDANGNPQPPQSMFYDDQHNQVIQTDRRGIQHIKQLDALGRTTSLSVKSPSLVPPYGAETLMLEEYVYDGMDHIIRFTDAQHNQTQYTYDGAGRQISVTEGFGSPVAATTTYTYDRAGNLLTVKDGRPHGGNFDVQYTYDARYRKVEETNGEAEKTTYVYDANNNLVRKSEPLGANYVTTYSYDELNKLLSVDETRGGAGGVTRYFYDGNRNSLAQQDASGNLVTYRYDSLNRLTDTFEHLAPGAMTSSMTRGSDPKGSAFHPGGDEATAFHWHYGYDGNDNQTLIVDALGQQVALSYDYLDRLSVKSYSQHTNPNLDFQVQSIAYRYDGNGNVTGIDEVKRVGGVTVTETYTKTYDALNRLTSATNYDGKTLSYTYDRQGNRLTLADPDGYTTTYTYDARNRLATATTESGVTGYDYWPDNLAKRISYPNGTVADYSDNNAYDRADRLLLVVNRQTHPAAEISRYAYTYDDNGNRLSQAEGHATINGGAVETTAYTYDRLNRLVHVSYGANGANGDITYTYDRVGNRLSEVGADPAAPAMPVNRVYAYDRANRLRSVTNLVDAGQSVAYFYDANGNQTSKVIGTVETTFDANGNPQVSVVGGASTNFAYDIRDEIVRTQELDGSSITFDYNADRLRVKKVSASTGETRYLYDDDATLLEYNATLDTTIKYNYGYELLSLTAVSPTSGSRRSQFYLFDGLMSTSDLVDGAGQVQISYQYDAFGNMHRTVGASVNPKQYTGHYYDVETDLHYFGGRYYDDATGRFLSQDLYLGEADTPPSLHRYLYAYSNPLRYVDLNGYEASEANAAQVTFGTGSYSYRRGGFTYFMTEGNTQTTGDLAAWVNGEDTRLAASMRNVTLSQVIREIFADSGKVTRVANQGSGDKFMDRPQHSLEPVVIDSTITFPGQDKVEKLFRDPSGFFKHEIIESMLLTAAAPIDMLGSMNEAYHLEGGGWRGLYAASQELNPMYHAEVSLYHAKQAWDKGDYAGAVNHAFDALQQVAKTFVLVSRAVSLVSPVSQQRVAVVRTDPTRPTRIKNINFTGDPAFHTKLPARFPPNSLPSTAGDSSRIVRFARSLQGSGNFPGVDRFTEVTLKKGTIVYGGAPGPSNFYTTGGAVKAAGGSAKKFFQGLQVPPHPQFGYRPGVTAYQVLEDVPAATGKTLANPQHGLGGSRQFVIENYERVLKPLYSIPFAREK